MRAVVHASETFQRLPTTQGQPEAMKAAGRPEENPAETEGGSALSQAESVTSLEGRIREY